MKIKNVIKEIEKKYKSGNLIYERLFAYFVNLRGYSFKLVTLKKGSTLFRARYKPDKNSFLKINELSYPPSKYVKNFSRLNRPYQSLFYASKSKEACLSEMIRFWFNEFNNGDTIRVTFAEWFVKEDLKLLIIPDTANKSELNKNTIKDMHSQELEFWDYISSKFKTSTKDDSNVHEFSAAFSNSLQLNIDLQEIDASGFIYSNVQNNSDVNIAIFPKFIDLSYIIPSKFTEFDVQRTFIDKSGLPNYKMIGHEINGFPNFNNNYIDWIK
jgi:hypothetical protein